MPKTKLDTEEQELLEAFEAGEFESDLDTDRREYLAKAAEETFKKDKRFNIRVSSRDLEALQRRALWKKGDVSGGLKDISAKKSGQRAR